MAIEIKSNFRNKSGFTIMETVMVMAIFVIAATYALALFVRSNTVQKRTANIQRTLADARYALEVMAREFRMGTLDYQYYGGLLPAMPISDLALLDSENNPIRFRRAETAPNSGRFVVQLYDDVTSQWYDLTPEDLNVTRLDFYLAPGQDPFTWQTGGYASNEQPVATIILETEGLFVEGGTLSQPRQSHFQTTVASR
jgi:prepilin-type N-terminal cleavage/methylation domain-containing protein